MMEVAWAGARALVAPDWYFFVRPG